MSTEVTFTPQFTEFGKNTNLFELSNDVGHVVSQFLSSDYNPCYPISTLICAEISPVHLRKETRDNSAANQEDLVFKMHEEIGENVFEIILQDKDGPRYGGYAVGDKLEILDETVNNHHVLLCHTQDELVRYQYDLRYCEYIPDKD